MSNFDNTNRGSIWKNEEKKSENQPDFNGSLNVTVTAGMTNYKNEVIVDDVEKYLIKDKTDKVVGFKMEFFVNAWRRKADASPESPALTWTISPKTKVSGAAPSASPAPAPVAEEDLPF